MEIDEEMRIYLIGDDAVLSYKKERAFVVGDGVKSIAEIVAENADRKKKLFVDENIDLMAVPNKGEWIQIQWRHNLGQGARMIRVDLDKKCHEIALARQALASVAAKVASVDLVLVNGEWFVGEINSGIMLENAVSNGEITEEEGYAIYDRIMDLMNMRDQ